MKRTEHPRVARFQRLYALLTGVAQPALPAKSQLSDHLSADIGLPHAHPAHRMHSLETFLADPWRR